MNTTKAVLFTSLGVFGLGTLFLLGSSSANFGMNGQKEKPMQIVTESTSYSEFSESIAGTRMEGKITEEQFNEMKQRRTDAEQRRTDAEQRREATEKAMESHDYDAWKKLHEGMDILEKIDSTAKFEKLIEMHSIMETAKEKADAIAKELGIERGIGQKTGGGKGMGGAQHQGQFMMRNKQGQNYSR